MSTIGLTRLEKVRRIFQQFDANDDGALNRSEMAELLFAANPGIKFSEEQIKAVTDEVFRAYRDFFHSEKGLNYEGLLKTYDDGTGNVDHDFAALGIELDKAVSMASETETEMKQGSASAAVLAAVSPDFGVMFDNAWEIDDDLEPLVTWWNGNGKLKGD